MNNTRRQIIETAFLLFLKKGFKAVRLSDIEGAAKSTRGTFYYHFTNTEGGIVFLLCLAELKKNRRIRAYFDIAGICRPHYSEIDRDT